jgi:hypothetical protein
MLPIADFRRWLAALLFGLMLALLLLIAAWLLRVFAPVAPTINLSAVQMPAAFASTVGAADPVPVLKASLDASRQAEKKLQAELASRQDDLRRQLEQCKPAEPPLPAERWSKGDLATLKGCWVLGRDVPMLHTFADGRQEQVTVKAGRICFDNQGGGAHEQVMIGPTGRWTCKAPMTAKFWSNGTLVAKQPAVVCEGEPPTKWAATQLTCRRVTDEMALCDAVDRSGRGQVEFRRGP